MNLHFKRPIFRFLFLTLFDNLEVTSINEIIKYGRGVVNKVLWSLPPIFKLIVRIELPYIIAPPVLMVSNKIRPITSLSSRNLQDTIKKQFGKSIMYSINSKNEQINMGMLENNQFWFNLWKIRNPILGNYRLKVLYKDIFCQLRRYRFGLTNSPLCLVCKETETVQHQLFECRNGKRMWNIYYMIFSETTLLKKIVMVELCAVTELVKAVILRLLMQIDRSEHVLINFIYLQIKQMLELEALVNKNKPYDDIIRNFKSLMLA